MPPPRQFGQEIDHNVRRGPNLTPTQREQIIAKYQAGISTAELVKEFGRSEHAIRCTVKRWTTHHTTQELPRSSQPPILSTQQTKLLYRAARKTCKIKYSELIRHAVIY
jgi:transposase